MVYGISKHFDICLILADPCMSSDTSSVSRSGKGFL